MDKTIELNSQSEPTQEQSELERIGPRKRAIQVIGYEAVDKLESAGLIVLFKYHYRKMQAQLAKDPLDRDGLLELAEMGISQARLSLGLGPS
jgi:hypothetical protein